MYEVHLTRNAQLSLLSLSEAMREGTEEKAREESAL